MRLKTTLDQWQTLYEIDCAGSIQAAALQLNKSHTTLIYALRKLEDQFAACLLKDAGRRIVGRRQSFIAQGEQHAGASARNWSRSVSSWQRELNLKSWSQLIICAALSVFISRWLRLWQRTTIRRYKW